MKKKDRVQRLEALETRLAELERRALLRQIFEATSETNGWQIVEAGK